MAASAVASLVNALASSDDKLNSLEELQLLLSTKSPQELRTVVPDVSILPVFACLNTNETTQQEVCCTVLERLLSALSCGLILENLHQEFIRWLQDGTAPVQTLCLSQLLRVSEESPELLSQSGALLVAVTSQLANSNQSLARLATTILVRIASTANGLEILYTGDVFDTLQVVMASDDTIRFRVFQLAVEVSSISPEGLEQSHSCGLLTKLVNEIHKDDILLQLNCLELLSDLAQSLHGLTFLHQQGVIAKLEEMMATAGDSPFGTFLLPGLIKFFGGLARFHPKEVLSHFHIFMGLVFTSVGDQGDPNVRGLAVDTIGFIGGTPEGKGALEKQGNAMTDCMENLGRLIRNSPGDLRTRALQAVAGLLALQVSDQTEELLQITQCWFSRLCPNPFDMIWSIAKQPFADLRLSALQVLNSLALLPWGQQLMNNAAGFKEYLLDRAVETTKEAKEAKFEVVRVLAESPTTRDVFGDPYYVQLMEFYRQGPFYVRAQAEVAFEET